MAIEMYCDGFVLDDTTEPKEGICIHCDSVTDRQERGFSTGYLWKFICDSCDEKNLPEPFRADFR